MHIICHINILYFFPDRFTRLVHPKYTKNYPHFSPRFMVTLISQKEKKSYHIPGLKEENIHASRSLTRSVCLLS